MPSTAELLSATLYPVLRRVEFRGKGRLRGRLPVDPDPSAVVRFPDGFRLRLDLRQALQRDFATGFHDSFERSLARRLLAGGGDALDVGAHVGLYTVSMASDLRGRGRVLAFEPNPTSRGRLAENIALNGLDNVVVVPAGASASPGEASLSFPEGGDSAWSSIGDGGHEDWTRVTIALTTIDEEVERHGLRPAFVKMDVEGHEAAALLGMERTIGDAQPALLLELSPETAGELEAELAGRGYEVYAVTARGIVPGPTPVAPGPKNVLFVPPALTRLLR
jgi:FkbM family methyltransferase